MAVYKNKSITQLKSVNLLANALPQMYETDFYDINESDIIKVFCLDILSNLTPKQVARYFIVR